MNLSLFLLLGIMTVQQLPMAFAGGGSARLVKGRRGRTSSFSDRKLDELPSDDSEDSGPKLKKGRVKGPSKRDCKMCKLQSYGIFVYTE